MVLASLLMPVGFAWRSHAVAQILFFAPCSFRAASRSNRCQFQEVIAVILKFVFGLQQLPT